MVFEAPVGQQSVQSSAGSGFVNSFKKSSFNVNKTSDNIFIEEFLKDRDFLEYLFIDLCDSEDFNDRMKRNRLNWVRPRLINEPPIMDLNVSPQFEKLHLKKNDVITLVYTMYNMLMGGFRKKDIMK